MNFPSSLSIDQYSSYLFGHQCMKLALINISSDINGMRCTDLEKVWSEGLRGCATKDFVLPRISAPSAYFIQDLQRWT